jgi:hypothetical protein
MRVMGKRPVSEKKPSSGEVVDLHKAPKAIADEFNEPIVVPFRGMFKAAGHEPFQSMFAVAADEPSSDAPTAEELLRDGAERQLEKLKRLGDHFGIDLSASDGWQLLALRIANYYHPGFKLVYDDWQAYYFQSLWGFTPCFPLKGKSPKRIGSEYNWTTVSKLLQPECLALLVNGRHSKRSDERICEHLVVSADEKMKIRKNRPEKARRTATLIRRLSDGRKRLKNQQHTTTTIPEQISARAYA